LSVRSFTSCIEPHRAVPLKEKRPMILALVIGIASAALSFHLAPKRGRRPVLWAALGFAFGVFALATLRLLPALPTADVAVETA